MVCHTLIVFFEPVDKHFAVFLVGIDKVGLMAHEGHVAFSNFGVCHFVRVLEVSPILTLA